MGIKKELKTAISCKLIIACFIQFCLHFGWRALWHANLWKHLYKANNWFIFRQILDLLHSKGKYVTVSQS